jgi:methoxymalonate biosynthesis acyl carrier protein
LSDSIQKDLQAFITGDVLRQDSSVATDLALVESGLVDSLGLLQIISHVESRYGVNLSDSASPDDFHSIDSLVAAIQRLTGT